MGKTRRRRPAHLTRFVAYVPRSDHQCNPIAHPEVEQAMRYLSSLAEAAILLASDNSNHQMEPYARS